MPGSNMGRLLLVKGSDVCLCAHGGVLRVRQSTKMPAALLVFRGRPAGGSRTTQEPTEPVHCGQITKTMWRRVTQSTSSIRQWPRR